MPTIEVPQYGGPKVQEASLPNARFPVDAPIAAFGGGEARANTLESAAGIAEDTMASANHAAILNANIKLGELQASIENEVSLLTGENAIGSDKKAMEQYRSGAQAIADTMHGPEQVAAFNDLAAKRHLDLSTTLDRHVIVETEKYKDQTFAGSVSMFTEEAARHPDQADEKIGDIYAITDVQAAERGWAPEATAKFKIDAASEIRSGVVRKFLDAKDPTRANQYFEAHRDEISARDAATLEPMLKRAEVDLAANVKADELKDQAIMATKPGQRPGVWDVEEKLRGIKDDATRNRVRDLVAQGLAAYNNAQDEAERQTLDSAAKAVIAGKSTDAVSGSVWASLSADEQLKLTQIADRLSKPDPVVTNPVTYDKLRKMSVQQPDMFLKESIPTYATTLSGQDMQSFIELQAGMLANDARAAQSLRDYSWDQALVERTLVGFGIGLPGTTALRADKDKVVTAEISYGLQREMIEAQKAGNKWDDADTVAYIDRAMARTQPGKPQQRWMGLTPQERIKATPTYMSIPHEDKDMMQSILADFSRRGLSVPFQGRIDRDDRILAAYHAALRRATNEELIQILYGR